MKTVAIICEYNPFHNGHEYQIKRIKEDLGEDTAIVAIMSGNFTQRGEIAFADKYLRAECAVRSGVNLVLELPFPFSSSSAEFFARSGVQIANSLACVDYLSFGSECADLDKLYTLANNMLSEKFTEQLKTSREAKRSGAVTSLIDTYNSIFDDKLEESFFSSNNILATEYIKALTESDSKIKPHTVKRLGAAYVQEKIIDCEFQSASAIRNQIHMDIDSALNFVPQNCKNTLLENRDEFPCDIERLSAAIISYFRLNSQKAPIHDADGGLYNRLRSASFEVDSISQLISLSDTKKYTSARIRRAVLNSFFGVTSSIVRKLPQYTQLLATDTVGQAILKKAKKYGTIPILTKPSRTEQLSSDAAEQKLLSDRADSVFQLTMPKLTNGNRELTKTPFIMKNNSKD